MFQAILTAAGIAMAIAGGAALAAPPDATPKDQSLVMSKIDTDHDGSVSSDEAKTAAATKFAALDTDSEGTLDASELVGIMGPGEAKKADPDKDGTLDKAEYLAAVEALFKEADTDHDGTLDPKELSSPKGRSLVALLAY